MCPMCTAAAATVAAGVMSSGGLAAFLFATLRHKPASRPARSPMETTMEQPTIATRDEWLAARQAC